MLGSEGAASKGAWKRFKDQEAAIDREEQAFEDGGRVGFDNGGQLVQPGPGRLGFKEAGLVDSMKIRFKLGDDIVENLNILMETDYPKSNKPEVIQKRIDDFAIEFKKITNRLPTANEIRGFGASSTTATSIKKAKYMKEGINYMEETDEMKKIKRIDVVGTEIEQKILTLSKDPKYIKEDGTPNIKKLAKDIYPDRKLDDARKQIRHTLERTIDYKGKKNIPGEITAAKQSKKNARENIKIAQKKAGIPTTKQADQVIDKILSQNEIYQKMSVEDIAKDKDFLKRLRVQIDSVTGDVTFDGYTKKSPVRGKVFTDIELAQHAKDKSIRYELFTPDHINPKATRMQNVGYPINFQAATYMENSHLANARTYLKKNPDGNWKPIDNYLSSKNLTIRGPEFKQKYGFKLPIKFNPETGTSNIVELSFKKTVPYPPRKYTGAAKAGLKGAFNVAKFAGKGALGATDLLVSLGKGGTGVTLGFFAELGAAMEQTAKGQPGIGFSQTILGDVYNFLADKTGLPKVNIENSLLKLAKTEEEKAVMKSLIDLGEKEKEFKKKATRFDYLVNAPGFEREGINMDKLGEEVTQLYSNLKTQEPKVINSESGDVLADLSFRLANKGIERLKGPLGKIVGDAQLKYKSMDQNVLAESYFKSQVPVPNKVVGFDMYEAPGDVENTNKQLGLPTSFEAEPNQLDDIYDMGRQGAVTGGLATLAGKRSEPMPQGLNYLMRKKYD